MTFFNFLVSGINNFSLFAGNSGLDSLLAPFMTLNFNSEAMAFSCFRAFITKYRVKLFVPDNSIGLKELSVERGWEGGVDMYVTRGFLILFFSRCMRCLTYVLSFLDAELASYLDRNGITPDLFAIPW